MNSNTSLTRHLAPKATFARALVLGGGGSAGATAAAQITGTTPGRLLADILAAPAPPRAVDGMPGAGRGHRCLVESGRHAPAHGCIGALAGRII